MALDFLSFRLACAGLLAGAPSLTAQTRELLAIDFTGAAFGISPTGQKRSLGPAGVTGCNAMATVNNTVYVSAVTGSLHQPATIDHRPDHGDCHGGCPEPRRRSA